MRLNMMCPRCKQGNILKVLIKELRVETFLCDECDAMWFNRINIGKMPFVDFETYMISKGLKSAWNEIIVVDSKI